MSLRLPVVLAVSAALLTLSSAASSADSSGSAPASRLDRTGATASPSSAAEGPRTERPTPVLPERVRGRAAVDALGDRLPAVAARNGLTARGLERLLTEDRTAWLSREGQVYYQEDLPAEALGDAGTTATAYPTTQTFALHSRPGAARTILLDFDGATVVGTDWSDLIGDGTHIGWDSDGSPTTFSADEHAWIQEVWRQVAETYAPFDVDVTTADPGTDGVRRSTTTDTTYGSHVVITSSAEAVAQACDSSCLGIAYNATFDMVDPDGYYQPAWVFADPAMAPMIAAQGAAHEAGHNLGLGHDGEGTATYYDGTAAWGPIMGSARTRAVSQFSQGEYAYANNTEDDFAVIQDHGLPLRTDDHGSTTATAHPLGALPAYDVSGVIETRADTDVFAVDHPCEESLQVAATGIGAQTTLDLSLEVLDAAGNQLGYASPTSGYTSSPLVSTGMDAQVSLAVAPGTYYVRVDGVGNGSPAESGWSDYGSLGQYRLTATGCPGTAPPITEPAPTDSGATEPTPMTDSSLTDDPSPTADQVPAVTRPGVPRIGTASSGRRGGRVTATARWAAPATNGGATITKYRVVAQRLDSRNRVLRNYYSAYQGPSVRALTMRLPRGRYVFKVKAWNRVGASAWSVASRGVYAR